MMRLAANRGSVLTKLVLLFGVAAAQCAAADTPLPAEASFLPGTVSGRVDYELWSELPFPHYGGKLQSGKHWKINASMSGAADSVAAWKTLKAAFLANGWTVFKEDPKGSQLYETLHFAQKGVEAWAKIAAFNANDIRIDVVETGPLPYPLVLTAPQATPEQIDPAKGDFPYLTPLPGTKPGTGRLDSAPFWVLPKGASQVELIATGSIVKNYPVPDGVTNLLFIAEYKPALTKAGWEIARESTGSDGMIVAHYSREGRNIWAELHIGGKDYSFKVADVGARDLAKSLSADCHVALSGLLFDFNKATLQAASDPVLQQVLALLMKDASIKVEVQGHTDNVGTDAYNQTLSDSRAATVVAWLTQHGIAAARLTSKGYGKTKPVADNGSDVGRGKNRRVEIADPGCVPKGK
jgi:OOP family OmpA-OmpF porin